MKIGTLGEGLGALPKSGMYGRPVGRTVNKQDGGLLVLF